MGFFDRIFEKPMKSKDMAKERLRLVLIHDRSSVSPQFLEMIKGDLIEVITRYMDIDERNMNVNLTKGEDSCSLVASIPIIRVKRGIG
ncbi:MAG: cell division topological specificity factor MinE [Bacillota bacterium]